MGFEMEINAKKLKEVILPRIELIADDERFYLIPDDDDHALSSYGRLYKHIGDKSWHKVPVEYESGECYRVNGKLIPVRKLLARVFFREGTYLYSNDYSPWNPQRWNITKLFTLTNREDLIETLQAKMEHREPQLDKAKKKHSFIGRAEFGKPINKVMRRTYYNMRSRATNTKFKERNANYRNTTISTDWLGDPEKFYDYILNRQYYYPGKMSLDKDLLGYGEANKYSPEYVIFLPTYINNVFTSNSSKYGYCIQKRDNLDGSVRYVVPQTAYAMRDEKQKDLVFDRYADALIAGRKRKADYIRRIVASERNAGYIPNYILDAMDKWANRCELGIVKIWEPAESVLKEMGVI